MSTEIQDETISVKWLYLKGYTISGAARRIGRSHQHVSAVLRGVRKSAKVVEALAALPQYSLHLREARPVAFSGEPDALMDMVTSMAKELGVPVPPPHAIARAIAPVMRRELARMRREAERARQRAKG